MPRCSATGAWGVGDLLGAVGLTDNSTLSDLLTNVPGLGGTTLSGLFDDFGLGGDTWSQIATDLLGTTTVDQYLTDIMSALVTAP